MHRIVVFQLQAAQVILQVTFTDSVQVISDSVDDYKTVVNGQRRCREHSRKATTVATRGRADRAWPSQHDVLVQRATECSVISCVSTPHILPYLHQSPASVSTSLTCHCSTYSDDATTPYDGTLSALTLTRCHGNTGVLRLHNRGVTCCRRTANYPASEHAQFRPGHGQRLDPAPS